MKRFLSFLATGALALGLTASASAQTTRTVGGGGLVLDDAHGNSMTLTTPIFNTPEWDAWSLEGFPNTWYAPVPPMNGAQDAFIYSGPIPTYGTGSITPYLAYWIPPGVTGFNNVGGAAGAWDFATPGQLGVLAETGLTNNQIPKWNTAGPDFIGSSLSDDGTTISSTESLNMGSNQINSVSELDNGTSPIEIGNDNGTIIEGGGGNTVNGGSIAIGWNHNVSGSFGATAIGNDNAVSGSSAVALGFNNTASATNSIAIGNANDAGGYESLALGTSATTSYNNSFVFGDGTAAIGDNANSEFIALASGGATFWTNTGETTGLLMPSGGGLSVLGGSVGIGLTNPVGQLANTSTNPIMQALGIATNGLNWENNSAGWTAIFNNGTSGAGFNGVGITIADQTAGSYAFYIQSNGVLFDVLGNGEIDMPKFSTAGVLHNAAGGALSSSLIVNGDITNGTIANNKLVNSSITVTGGTGLGVTGSPVSLGGTLALSNTGVTSNVAGTGIGVSGATGAVTISNTGVLGVTGTGAGINVTAGQNPVITNTGVTSFTAGDVLYATETAATGAVSTPALNTETANKIFGGPASGVAATPTFRSLVLADLPGSGAITVTGSTGLTVGGSPVSLGGTLTLTNSGVTSNVAGTGIGVSGPTGAVTISNTGVLGVTGTGAGINVTAGQNPVVTNTGVTSAVAGTGIGVSGATGAVTFSNTGVTSFTAGDVLYATETAATGAVSTPALNTETANKIFGGPASGVAATPTFRSLVLADLPGSGAITVTGGTGLGVTGSPVSLGGTLALSNTGVTSNVAGTGIGVSGPTGAVTITNNGVTSNVAGTGIGVSGPTGAVTITNNGVTSAIAGTGIGVSGATGAVTFSNTGVTSFTFTGGTLYGNAASSTGAVTLAPGLNTQANNVVFAGPNGGGPLAPTFRALALADLPGSGAITVTGSTGLTVGGSPVSLGGTLTLTNSGVTSITGTANQITASASTGAVGLSIPNALDLGTTGSSTGGITLANSTVASNPTTIQGGNATAAVTYILPLAAPGAANDVLQANGTTSPVQLSWAAPSGSSATAPGTQFVAGSVNTVTTTYEHLGTGPSVTLALTTGERLMVIVTCRIDVTAAAAYVGWMSWDDGGTPADADAVEIGNDGAGDLASNTMSTITYITSPSTGNVTFNADYKASVSTANIAFSNRTITVIPLN